MFLLGSCTQFTSRVTFSHFPAGIHFIARRKLKKIPFALCLIANVLSSDVIAGVWHSIKAKTHKHLLPKQIKKKFSRIFPSLPTELFFHSCCFLSQKKTLPLNPMRRNETQRELESMLQIYWCRCKEAHDFGVNEAACYMANNKILLPFSSSCNLKCNRLLSPSLLR